MSPISIVVPVSSHHAGPAFVMQVHLSAYGERHVPVLDCLNWPDDRLYCAQNEATFLAMLVTTRRIRSTVAAWMGAFQNEVDGNISFIPHFVCSRSQFPSLR